jgi:hypothetical protein
MTKLNAVITATLEKVGYCIACATIMGIVVQPANAGPLSLVDVQFTGGSGPVATGAAATGSAGDEWNTFTSANSSGTSGITTVTGASTTVTLSWSSSITYNTTGTINAVNPNLESGYLDGASANSHTVDLTIAGLQANSMYDLWFYNSTCPCGSPTSRPDDVTANGVELSDAGTAQTSFVSGQNYVEFVDLESNSSGQIVITAVDTSESGNEADVNGFQIESATPAPEPGTIGLFGSGLVFLAGLRRRACVMSFARNFRLSWV